MRGCGGGGVVEITAVGSTSELTRVRVFSGEGTFHPVFRGSSISFGRVSMLHLTLCCRSIVKTLSSVCIFSSKVMGKVVGLSYGGDV